MNAFKQIALVGYPNSGKTTLFNQLTGLKQKVGNWPGVTVEKKEGAVELSTGESINLIDLPGINSLLVTEEEQALDATITRQLKK